MASTDLIEQIQITLRTNAGLPSYNPLDPSLPSVDAAIAGLDPSPPPHLRCKHCKGKLLRGLYTVICVYCGKRHKNDAAPVPLSFNSTFAYRWLLESLHFDGSEVVEPPTEKISEFNRRQNKPKEKISLSKLLDLQITWPDEPEEPETNAVNASEEQPAVSNQNAISGNNTFVNPKNLSFFQEVLPSETVIQSPSHASSDSFTGWEADFQSGDAKNQHEDSKSVEPIIHIDAKSGMPADSADKPSSNCADWFQDNSWQSNSDSSKDKKVKVEGDSFDEWNDLANSNVNQNSGQPKPEMDLLKSRDQFQEVDFRGFSQSDPLSGSSSNAIGIGEPIYIQPEVSTTNRTIDATKVGESFEQADVSTEAHRKDDAEMLMSQMRDLSFMFESSLSVPSKPDGLDSI